MSVVALTAGMSDDSASVRLARELAGGIAHELGEAVHSDDVVALRPYARSIADAMVTGFPSADLGEVFAAVAQARCVVAATPIYNALPSGLFVSFFDVLPEGTMRGKPVALGATGGSPRHSLIVEHAMRPMFIYLHATVATTAVYAATEEWGAPGVGFDATAGRQLAARIEREALETALLVRTMQVQVVAEQATDLSAQPDPAAGNDARLNFPDFISFDQMMPGASKPGRTYTEKR